MRRLLALPITAFLALLLTGTVAAGGPNVQNISGGATIPQADWETSDANGGYTSGYAAASVEQGQSAAYLEFSQQSVTWVLCSDAGTPNDESDDVYGSVGSFSYGNGAGNTYVGQELFVGLCQRGSRRRHLHVRRVPGDKGREPVFERPSRF